MTVLIRPVIVNLSFLFLLGMSFMACRPKEPATPLPNIILVMSDDQGYGQVGYYDHPLLQTPNLVSMAENGLRLDRFYAGAPVCSPTRATVLTGRSNDRTAVFSHGFPIRLQEKTLAQALRKAGYQTAHFGKWHLNGLKGPGVPILADDQRHPGHLGFDEWISVTNFFDIDPLMSHRGKIEEYRGNSSDIIVRQAVNYMANHQNGPFFVVIWFGSPHDPWRAQDEDKHDLPPDLTEKDKNYLGEIVEMDKSIGRLRTALRKMELADNTLLWFNSDNGGLPQGGPEGVGGLRGFKGSIYEGGLRVPCIIEWPAQIPGGSVSDFPAATMDIFPTIASLLELPDSAMTQPIDGISLAPVFGEQLARRETPIPFKWKNLGALIDNEYKLVVEDIALKQYALYNLRTDRAETTDLSGTEPEKVKSMIDWYEHWLASLAQSVAGRDYTGGLASPDPPSRFWWDAPEYGPYLKQWQDRPEYHFRLERAGKLQ